MTFFFSSGIAQAQLLPDTWIQILYKHVFVLHPNYMFVSCAKVVRPFFLGVCVFRVRYQVWPSATRPREPYTTYSFLPGTYTYVCVTRATLRLRDFRYLATFSPFAGIRVRLSRRPDAPYRRRSSAHGAGGPRTFLPGRVAAAAGSARSGCWRRPGACVRDSSTDCRLLS